MKTLIRWAPVVLVSGVAVACQVSRLLHPSGGGGDPPPDTVPARVAFATQPNSAGIGQAITPPVAVVVTDSAGNPVIGYTGSVTVALGANPTGATLSGANTATAVNGVAAFPGLSLNKAGTGYTLTAAASGLAGATSATFDVMSRPTPPPTHLVFTVQPATTQAGVTMTPAVQVTVQDSTGSTSLGYNGTVTVALGNNPGGGTLSGTTTVAVSGGVASFGDLKLDRAGTGYTLVATASGLAGATSQSFDITAPPPPPAMATALKFTGEPQSAQTGVSIGTITVAAVDSTGATVTDFSGTVTLAIGANPGGGTLSGTTSTATSGGVATFSGLSIDKAGTGYTLTATTLGLNSATSTSFEITAQSPPPTTGSLTVTTSTSGSNLDPDGYTVSVDGGASQSISDNGSVTFSNLSAGSHTVTLSGLASNCQAGSASQTASVPAGGSASASFAVTCQASPPPNQPPVVNAGGNQTQVVAVLYTLNASFSDPDANGPWTFTINWGDGSSSSGSVSTQGAISPTHTYAVTGNYQIIVSVTDAGGLTGSDSKTLTVIL
jgi:hypothetical protein